VYFSHAERFDWSTAIEAEDTRFDYGEVRWVALGFIDNQLFVLVYTPRNATIRIISLRKATKREQVYYETQT